MPSVRLEPIEEEIECGDDETVLDAAFRQGFNLVHGCREGQCSACKCFLLEGEVTLKRYSSFALSDTEESQGYTLLCRAMPDSDLVVELLHVDDDYRLAHPIVEGRSRVTAIDSLTHDIYRLELEVTDPADTFGFEAGQYVDLVIPGTETRRSFSMANLPDGRIELIIKHYPGGAFSSLLAESLKVGDELDFHGPYGSLRLRESDRDVLMIAGGSGMAPVLGLLRELARRGGGRKVAFFYGGRARADLFYGEEIAALVEQIPELQFIQVLSEPAGDDGWDGAQGFVHEAACAALAAGELTDPEVYMCGPPPMIDAAIDDLTSTHGVAEDDIHFDKFTTAAEAE
ncbi:MAG TPA: 2Fe-2S iron-sulfur cluster binding domain-containing protein [Solirubrobacteraceae bacterium]|jgi:propane monooxygenase reductase subunit|nr:2Fe-2S iron-sulfur cluster binding domain-containing protein [Solirubrobacteraceae bacterium]